MSRASETDIISHPEEVSHATPEPGLIPETGRAALRSDLTSTSEKIPRVPPEIDPKSSLGETALRSDLTLISEKKSLTPSQGHSDIEAMGSGFGIRSGINSEEDSHAHPNSDLTSGLRQAVHVAPRLGTTPSVKISSPQYPRCTPCHRT